MIIDQFYLGCLSFLHVSFSLSLFFLLLSQVFFYFKIFYSKYALLHTLQLLDAQFNVTNSTNKHTL